MPAEIEDLSNDTMLENMTRQYSAIMDSQREFISATSSSLGVL